jgi:hypothetical protein
MKSIKDIFTNRINVGEEERIISAGIGTALIVMSIPALRNPTAITWIELIAGGFLASRGITGYCPVNAALGRNTAEEAEEKFESLAE